MTSATERLRALLDERGVEYETYTEELTGFEHVKWNFNEHGSADFNLEFGEPWLTMYGVISGPEQAIAATLETGTCHMEHLWSDDIDGVCWWCKACDKPAFTHGDFPPNYCPNCGRKVVA